jgi:hypothetical protein
MVVHHSLFANPIEGRHPLLGPFVIEQGHGEMPWPIRQPLLRQEIDHSPPHHPGHRGAVRLRHGGEDGELIFRQSDGNPVRKLATFGAGHVTRFVEPKCAAQNAGKQPETPFKPLLGEAGLVHCGLTPRAGAAQRTLDEVGPVMV